jgi:hypothetical protein
METDTIGEWFAGASAIGTAAFGVVETLKRTPLGVIGVTHVVNAVGAPGQQAFRGLYGADYEAIIAQAYRGDPKKLGDQLKDALRVALRDKDLAAAIAKEIGQGAMEPSLAEAVEKLEANNNGSEPLPPADLARYTARVTAYTMAVDARVEAGIAAAASHYEAGMRTTAMFVALALSVGAWFAIYWRQPSPGRSIWEALILGLLAVPIAPVAKDATSILQTASDLLTRRLRRPL